MSHGSVEYALPLLLSLQQLSVCSDLQIEADLDVEKVLILLHLIVHLLAEETNLAVLDLSHQLGLIALGCQVCFQ